MKLFESCITQTTCIKILMVTFLLERRNDDNETQEKKNSTREKYSVEWIKKRATGESNAERMLKRRRLSY